MTEEEAKTKWCPMARESGAESSVFWNKPLAWLNRYLGMSEDDARDKAHLCIGSACMAWRWTAFSQYSVYPYASRALAEEHIEGIKEFDPPELPQIGGYCGLAGKP